MWLCLRMLGLMLESGMLMVRTFGLMRGVRASGRTRLVMKWLNGLVKLAARSCLCP